ncbi:MAG TPA: ABC transporter permease, partial [Bryobacteraceae bacterium]|nr:ABC transporter permease [Bryobacteraceae bacterium]
MLFLEDVRQALRLFRRSPGLTAIALLSIAITTGATAVVFAAIKSVLLDPLPYKNAGALVQLRTDYTRSRPHFDWVSWADMQDLQRANHSFESLATYHYALVDLTGNANNPPDALYGLYVSAGLFPMLGVKPMLGRNISPDETQIGRDREIILSYGLWTRRFASDRGVIGRSIEINGHPWIIIGVMPADFDFPLRQAVTMKTPSQHMDFWAPEAVDPAKLGRTGGYCAVARLKPGVSLAGVQQDLDAISAELARLYPRTNAGHVLHFTPLPTQVMGTARTGLWLLMGAAVLFMLIGCANVANLLLARSLARQREIAVRLALGAGPKRIARQLVTESCVLALAGGLAGYALTALAWTLLPAVAPMSIPRLAAARADGSVLAFTIVVAVLNGILFGLAPAFRSARHDPAAPLRESGSRGSVGAARN